MGAVADLRNGGSETSKTVSTREVVPALHHGWQGMGGILWSCESGVGVVGQLCSEVREGGV
jgi:hypothetical protein